MSFLREAGLACNYGFRILRAVYRNNVRRETTKSRILTERQSSNQREANGMTTLEKALPQFNDMQRELNKLSSLNWKKLEENLSDESLLGAAADSRSNIQCIINRIKEFEDKRKFYQLSQAICHAIDAILQYRDTFGAYPLNNEEFTSIEKGLHALMKSVNSIQKASSQLVDIDEFSIESPKKDLNRWADNLERLADEIEDSLSFFPLESLDSLEESCTKIIIEAQKKPASERKRALTRRLRFAAGFILNLVESEREEALEEEKEAIEHFQRLGRASQPIDKEDIHY